MGQFDSPQFKKLQAQWYKKLAKNGFKDHETSDERLISPASDIGQLRALKQITPESRDAYRQIGDSSKLEYYSLASEFLLYFKFKSIKEYKIFELHAQGVPYRGIAKALKRYKGASRSEIARVIAGLAKLMLKGSWRPLEDAEGDF